MINSVGSTELLVLLIKNQFFYCMLNMLDNPCHKFGFILVVDLLIYFLFCFMCYHLRYSTLVNGVCFKPRKQGQIIQYTGLECALVYCTVRTTRIFHFDFPKRFALLELLHLGKNHRAAVLLGVAVIWC